MGREDPIEFYINFLNRLVEKFLLNLYFVGRIIKLIKL